MYAKDSVELKVSPEVVFDWLMHFDENYLSWHPDHLKCIWIKGKPFEVDSVLYVEEFLGGELHKLKFKITSIKKNKGFKFRILFPASIFIPTGEFSIEKTTIGSRFTAILYYRFGKLLSLFAKREKEIIEKHQREEGSNLKKLLEGNCET